MTSVMTAPPNDERLIRQLGAFVPRKAHDPGGMGYIFRVASGLPPLQLPADAAGYHSWQGRSVLLTWEELHAQRTALQNERLERKRWFDDSDRTRPAQVWTFFVPGMLFGGWWCYIRDAHGEMICGNGYKHDVTDESRLALHLMKIIPLGFLPQPESFCQWMIAFAKQYPRRHPNPRRRKDGMLTGWSDGSWFELTKEALQKRQMAAAQQPELI